MEKNLLRGTLRISSAVYLESLLNLSSCTFIKEVALVYVFTSELELVE